VNRPLEIVWFERLIIGTLLLGALNSWLSWQQLASLRGPSFAIATQSLTFACLLGLTLLVSRRRSNVAKWAFIILFVLGLPFSIRIELAGNLPGLRIIRYAQWAAQIFAYALLFRPASRRWFKKEPSPS
jgi:hypothetical protein